MQRQCLERKAIFGAILTVLLLTMVAIPIVFLPRGSASPDGWWNASWKYRKAVTVANPNSFELLGYPTNITLDTTSLVSTGKMKPDGSDLRLLRDSEEISFAVVGFNTTSTKIVFKSSVPAAGSNPNYTLYYGNPLASDASVSYEKIRYELIDEFNDGAVDPMWTLQYHDPTQPVPTHNESDGVLYIEKGAVDGAAIAYATDLKINNSEALHIQFRAYTAEIGWAGYWGTWAALYPINYTDWRTAPQCDYMNFETNTYDKSPNVAGPRLEFRNGTGYVLSSEVNASRIDWTQTNNIWYDYDICWNESNNFARMTMNDTWYDNENTNGLFEDYSFDEFCFGVFAYVPSGKEYGKFDYIRIWQEVSQEPTTSLGEEQVYAYGMFFAEWKSVLYTVEVYAPNCSLSQFTFDHSQKQVSLIAEADAVRDANITIPQTLLDGVLTVFVDDTMTPAIFSTDGTHISVYLTYEQGLHTIRIQGQFVTPIQGDLNHDDTVDILDAIILSNHFLEHSS